MPWLPSLLSRSLAPPTDQTSTMQEDDDWCNISDEDVTGTGSGGDGRPRDIGWAAVEKELGIESCMPTLFSNDLPPCGLMPQLAYENVAQRLRKLWLERATQPSANIPIPSLCRLVLSDLKAEEERTPSGSQNNTKKRNPWRREAVFRYELCWAKYFVREAETAEKRPKMTEKQLDKQDFMDKMFPIPKELEILVRNQKNQKVILGLWKEWHHKKRGTVEQESAGLGVGGAREDDSEAAVDDTEDGKGNVDDSKHAAPTE